MSNRNLFGIIIVLGIVGGFVYWVSINRPSPTPAPPFPALQIPTSEITTPYPTQSSAILTQTIAFAKESVKTISIETKNYSFTPNEIRVKKGMTIIIQLQNKEGMHDFVLDEFTAKTKQIKTGEEDVVAFVVDKTGTFEYYCSVGNHREIGMKGSLIVE